MILLGAQNLTDHGTRIERVDLEKLQAASSACETSATKRLFVFVHTYCVYIHTYIYIYTYIIYPYFYIYIYTHIYIYTCIGRETERE